MSTARVTANFDFVEVKTPGATIIPFKQTAGNADVLNFADIDDKAYITKAMFNANIPAGQSPQVLAVYPAGSAAVLFLDITDYPDFGQYATIIRKCPEVGAGTVTTTASGTTVTGSGTNFLTQFQVGQKITVNSETRTISHITDNTHLTTDAWTGANSGLIYLTGNMVQYDDIQVREVFVGAAFAGWNIYGHTNDGTTTSEDLYIILKP